jgi:hypothetical protein
VIYFAVIDQVAAVGLWLTSVWGGVMWLLAIMSHLILGFFFPVLFQVTSCRSFFSSALFWSTWSYRGWRTGRSVMIRSCMVNESLR